jgi:hypothetical protein
MPVAGAVIMRSAANWPLEKFFLLSTLGWLSPWSTVRAEVESIEFQLVDSSAELENVTTQDLVIDEREGWLGTRLVLNLSPGELVESADSEFGSYVSSPDRTPNVRRRSHSGTSTGDTYDWIWSDGEEGRVPALFQAGRFSLSNDAAGTGQLYIGSLINGFPFAYEAPLTVAAGQLMLGPLSVPPTAPEQVVFDAGDHVFAGHLYNVNVQGANTNVRIVDPARIENALEISDTARVTVENVEIGHPFSDVSVRATDQAHVDLSGVMIHRMIVAEDQAGINLVGAQVQEATVLGGEATAFASQHSMLNGATLSGNSSLRFDDSTVEGPVRVSGNAAFVGNNVEITGPISDLEAMDSGRIELKGDFTFGRTPVSILLFDSSKALIAMDNVDSGSPTFNRLYDDSLLLLERGSLGWVTLAERARMMVRSGIAEFVFANDESLVVVQDGTVELSTADSATGYISGGIVQELATRDDSIAHVAGGLLNALRTLDNSTINIYGSGFNYPDGPIVDQIGTLRGTLSDGSVLDVLFERESENGRIVLISGSPPPFPAIPEPSAMSLAVVTFLIIAQQARFFGTCTEYHGGQPDQGRHID